MEISTVLVAWLPVKRSCVPASVAWLTFVGDLLVLLGGFLLS